MSAALQNGMDKRLAEFWREAEERTGNGSLVMDPGEIRQLAESPNSDLIAVLQTQALYGRPKSLAYYLYYLELTEAGDDELAFWRGRAGTAQAKAAIVRLDYQKTDDPSQMSDIIDRFVALADSGSPEVGIDIGKVVQDHFSTDKARIALAEKYLAKAAQAGFGKALWMLADFRRADRAARAELNRKYAPIIEARGDSSALLFAARYASDPEIKSRTLQRAIGVMPCDFDNAMQVLDEYSSLGSSAHVDQWLDIVEQLATGNGWRMVAAADRRLELQGDPQLPHVIELYTASMALGEQSAPSRLLKLYANAKAPTYDPDKAVAMFTTLIGDADVEELGNLLQRVSKAAPVIRDPVLAKVSVPELYAGFAEQGSPLGMREFARLIRDGRTKNNPVEATAWFEKAAASGDAEAMVDLAKAYAFGVGVKPSIEEATSWLKLASTKGNPEARQLLGTMVQQGATQ